MDGVIIERIIVGPLQTNCYIIADSSSRKGFVVDPGDEAQRIREVIKKQSIDIVGVINTHGHFDHIRANSVFSREVYVHSEDVELLRNPNLNFSAFFPPEYIYHGKVKILEDNDTIEMGDKVISLIHTPGHTPGGICLLCGDILLSGDTLFAKSIGRTDALYGSHDVLVRSIKEKLMVLDGKTNVFPGHGEPTTIEDESVSNPFITAC